MRVPLDRLVVGADHPPGLHLPAVLALVDGSRLDDRALEVAPLPGWHPPDEQRWEIVNGRHRYVAALIHGRPDLPCTVRATT